MKMIRLSQLVLKMSPAISYDAMLSMTKVVLELISDADMYLFFEKGMIDWVSFWNI